MELIKHNKNRIIILTICLLAAIVVILMICIPEKESNQLVLTGKSGYEQAAEALDIDFNADIIVYKEDPGFIEDVKYRVVDKITDESLNYDESHGYRAIVLYDKEDNLLISDEELLLIKKYVEEKGYDMFYIGKQYLDDFQRLKFTKGCDPDEASLEYIGSYKLGEDVQQNEYGNIYAEHGLWTDSDVKDFQNDEDKVQSRIIMLMWDYARKAAGIDF
ncbi:MAG: hypothetical protein UF228_06595 [Lachnospiraceae bacterium]|nr:hypothetical protein [Lachnospiraceae bacterium]